MKKFYLFALTSFGFSLGLFFSFFVIVLIIDQELFNKPWDIIWTGLFAIVAAVSGSFVGGLFAFQIAKHQLNQQNQKDEEKRIKSQEEAAQIINEEIKKNQVYLEMR